jgi:hypothetical protein
MRSQEAIRSSRARSWIGKSTNVTGRLGSLVDGLEVLLLPLRGHHAELGQRPIRSRHRASDALRLPPRCGQLLSPSTIPHTIARFRVLAERECPFAARIVEHHGERTEILQWYRIAAVWLGDSAKREAGYFTVPWRGSRTRSISYRVHDARALIQPGAQTRGPHSVMTMRSAVPTQAASSVSSDASSIPAA